MVASVSARATAPSGTFTKKTHRHDALSAMNPPISGPAITPATPPAPSSALYFPRSRSGTVSAIVASVSGQSAPAPMPCSPRKTISSGMLVARPQSAELTMNVPIATTKSGRRPYASPSFP